MMHEMVRRMISGDNCDNVISSRTFEFPAGADPDRKQPMRGPALAEERDHLRCLPDQRIVRRANAPAGCLDWLKKPMEWNDIVAAGVDEQNPRGVLRPRSNRSAAMLDRERSQPRFARFAAAMDAARAAGAPGLALYRDDADTPALPAASGPQLLRPVRPAAVRWRSERTRGRPLMGWLGIGSFALLLGILFVSLQPTGAEIEWPFGKWFGSNSSDDTAASRPQTDQTAAVIPEPRLQVDGLPLRSPPHMDDLPPPSKPMSPAEEEKSLAPFQLSLAGRSEPAGYKAEAGGAKARATKAPTPKVPPLPELKPAASNR
jgi:hypothetical protein